MGAFSQAVVRSADVIPLRSILSRLKEPVTFGTINKKLSSIVVEVKLDKLLAPSKLSNGFFRATEPIADKDLSPAAALSI